MSFEYNGLVVPQNWLIAFGWIIFASFWRLRARDNWSSWKTANKPTPRSFDVTDAPILVTRRGCMGFIRSWIYDAIFLICVIFAFDQAAWSGFLASASSDLLRQWLVAALRG